MIGRERSDNYLYTMRGQRPRRISGLYQVDFPTKVAPTVQKTSMTHSSSNSTSATDVVVQVTNEVIDDETVYKARLQDWNDDVKKYECSQVDSFLKGHCSMVVDNLADPKELIKKLTKIPVMLEPKRKMFTQDLGNHEPCDWQKLKKRRLSMFQSKQLDIEPEKLDCLIEVYTRFRTETDKKDCEDTIVVMVPGAPPNMPFNKVAEVAVRAIMEVSRFKNCKQP